MRRYSRVLVLVVSLAASAGRATAQTFPTPGYFRNLLSAPQLPSQLRGPEGLRDYLANGKLRLGLADAILLALANNTEVRINQLPVEQARYAVERAHQPFDPTTTSIFNSIRSSQPTFTQLSGAPTLSTLSQQTTLNYSQTFQTGTRYDIGLNASKLSTNTVFATFNPSLFSSLNFSITQPLLRNRGIFPNRAPIIIAQRNLSQSRAAFEAQINDSIQMTVAQYWDVVRAREDLEVLRKSQEAAEASYQRDKRALELGALPPLDIYRSESEVAARRVAVLQAEYVLKVVEDQLRRTVGADLDPYFRALDLDLVEKTEPGGELFSIDAATALERALARRPELEGLRQQLAGDESSVRLAHNKLQPDLTLTGLYSSNGLSGNQLNTPGAQPAVISRGGFGDAFSQVFGFGFPTYGFIATLNLPIKNRSAQADLGSALVGRRRTLYQLRQSQQMITQEVSNAVHQLEQAKLSMAASKIARDLAQKTLEAEERKHELGSQPIFFVLQAQTQLAQAEANLVESEIAYQRALTAVEHATGTLLDRYHVQIEGLVR